MKKRSLLRFEGGHFSDKSKFMRRLIELAPDSGEIGHGGLRINRANDRAQIAAAEESRRYLYRMIRKVLWQYGFEDTLVALFDKVPATENEMSWQQRDTAAKQQAAILRGVPAICLNTIPKSGTMYLRNAFSKALNMPSIHISVELFPEDRLVPNWAALHCRGGCMSVQHMDGGRDKIDALRALGLDRIWVHVRDPRQTLVSMYHYANSGNPGVATEIDATYYEYSVEQRVDAHIGYFPNLVKWMRSWKNAAESESNGMRILVTRHEDLRRDTPGFFDEVCAFFDVDRAAFTPELISPPRSGNLHFRKGETSEWRRVFTASQQARLNEMLPDDLIQFFDWER